MSKLDLILDRLEKVKSTGPDRWLACCPAHDDNHPSFTVKVTKDGTILMKCWAGCDIDQIVGALGITLKDLFPNKLDNWSPLKTHERWIPRDVIKALSDDCLLLVVYASALESGKTFSEKDHKQLVEVARRFHAAALEVGCE